MEFVWIAKRIHRQKRHSKDCQHRDVIILHYSIGCTKLQIVLFKLTAQRS